MEVKGDIMAVSAEWRRAFMFNGSVMVAPRTDSGFIGMEIIG